MTAKSVPMQYEDKFHSLARAVEVTEDELAIAKFFWYAGLRHAFQRGTSSPALLEKAPAVATQATQANLPDFPVLPTVAPSANAPETSVAASDAVEVVTLTKYEAKLLQLALQGVLSQLQEDIKGVSHYGEFLWKLCDPVKASTLETFKEMNRTKDIVRKCKKHLAVLNNAQRKLKKLSKGT